METSQNFRYIEWKSPDEMHYSAQQWSSSIDFIKDEHHFFEDMLKEYTMPILHSHFFSEVKALITELDSSKEKQKILGSRIKQHKKDLEILLDGIDQPEDEKRFKEEHRKLLSDVQNFIKEFEALKKRIFSKVSQAIKKEKQKRLLE